MTEAQVEGLIREMHGDLKVVKSDVAEVKEHQRLTNGHIADLKAESYRVAGAVSMLRWMVSFTLAGIGTGAALAGVILAIVAN